jgi:hypothetical protein
MGGTVNVKSVVGEGSTFSILFKVMCKVPDAEIIENPITPRSKVNLEKLKQSNQNLH